MFSRMAAQPDFLFEEGAKLCAHEHANLLVQEAQKQRA